jgi:hypothetical protein
MGGDNGVGFVDKADAITVTTKPSTVSIYKCWSYGDESKADDQHSNDRQGREQRQRRCARAITAIRTVGKHLEALAPNLVLVALGALDEWTKVDAAEASRGIPAWRTGERANERTSERANERSA